MRPVTKLIYSEGSDSLPELTDPSGRYSRDQLRSMENELTALISGRASAVVDRITFQAPLDGLPSAWRIENRAKPDDRCPDVVLRPATTSHCLDDDHDTGDSRENNRRVDVQHPLKARAEKRTDGSWIAEMLKEFQQLGDDASRHSGDAKVYAAIHESVVEKISEIALRDPGAMMLLAYHSLLQALAMRTNGEGTADNSLQFKMALQSLDPLFERTLHSHVQNFRSKSPHAAKPPGVSRAFTTVLSLLCLGD